MLEYYKELPLERRCAIARKSIADLRLLMQKIGGENLLSNQSVAMRGEELASKISDPERQKARSGLVNELNEMMSKLYEKQMELMWEAGIDLERRLCGSDAVDLVLAEFQATDSGS